MIHNRLYETFAQLKRVDYEGFILQVDPRDRVISKKLALYGAYEKCVQRLLLSLAKPGTTVIDVGANIGLHTLPLARRVGPHGRVIAFEPDPDNFRILRENLEANGLTNVVAHPYALSASQGTVLLYQSAANRGALSLHELNIEQGENTPQPVSVSTVVGDEMLRQMRPPISLIKIDVEGAEPLVIKGMEQTLRDNSDASIVFEFSPRYIANFGVDPLEFLLGLERAGLNLYVVDEKHARTRASRASDLLPEAAASEYALNVLASRHAPPF